MMDDDHPDHRRPPPSALREAWRLAAHLRDQAWAVPTMLLLGLAAAVAETTGVAFAAMFLFAVLGQHDALGETGGLLTRAFDYFGAIFEGSSAIIVAIFLGLILVNALLLYAYNVTTASVMNRVAERIRDRVHEVYVRVGYRYMQERDRGALVHTLASETWAVSEATYALARMGVNLSAGAVFGLGLLVFSWPIAVTALLCMGANFALQRLLSRPLRRYGEETLAENQILSERMLVSLQGMRTLRAFAQERFVLRVFSASSSRVRRLAVRAEQLKALTGPLGEITSLGSIVLIVLVAGWVSIDIPTIIASVMLLFRLQPHLREFESHRLALAGMGASLRNVRETLEREGKPWPTEGTIPFAGLQRDIRFEDVSFVHDPRRGPSLDRVSFSIRCGAVTALSGPSGSGKTTIINLLLRLYEPSSGVITVDGTDLLSLTRESWLGRVAVAGQDVELIEGTVEQNIRLAKHDATPEELHEACTAAEILDDILAIPEGFAARIGPGGLSFSGGQRQRIGLARALVRRPDFLILDEALGALEPALEDRIRARVARIMAGKTVLVISHRADAAASADAVVRIAGGRVIGEAAVAAAR